MDPRSQHESLHFQRRAWVLDAVSWLSTHEGQSILVLAGTSGFGRRHFLDAVAAEARSEDFDVSVWTLDLEGYEPDAGDLTSAIGFAIDRVHGAKGKRGAAKFDALADLLDCAVPSFWSAALLTLAIQHDEPRAALVEALGDEPEQWLCAPRSRDREALSRWLQWCARDGRAILHVTARSRLTANQRRWLLAEAALEHRLTIALACETKAETRRVAPGAAKTNVLRFDDEPLTRDEVAACLDRRFHPNTFPNDLLDGLHESTRGSQSAVGARIADLLARGVILRNDDALTGTVHGKTTKRAETESSGWHLRDETPADTPLADELERSLVAEALDTVERHPDHARSLTRALLAATLCGRSVPVDLVLGAVIDDDNERAAVRDILRNDLTRTTRFFIDLGRDHPSFPEHDVWLLEPSLRRRALRDDVLVIDDSSTSTELATRLIEAFATEITRRTRGAVELIFTVSRHADDVEQQIQTRRELDWWIGADEADDLVDEVERAMSAGEVSADAIWAAADSACRVGTPARALALLAAHRRAPRGLPPEIAAAHWARCAHLNARIGERDRAIAAIEAARAAQLEHPRNGRVDLYIADLPRLHGHLRGRAAAAMHSDPKHAPRFPHSEQRTAGE